MASDSTSISRYYRKRAPYYDRVYNYPERQRDLRYLEQYIPAQFAQKDVLEVAAGTGYWTQFISLRARSILATDIIREPLQQIEKRPLGCPVSFRIQDAYELSLIGQQFDGIFSALWISHIPRQKLAGFFQQLHQCAEDHCRIVLIDNSRAQCERLPISSTDDYGNTYQSRTLDDGSRHLVLKNFPEEEELISAAGPRATRVEFSTLDHFWLLEYTFNRNFQP